MWHCKRLSFTMPHVPFMNVSLTAWGQSFTFFFTALLSLPTLSSAVTT